MKKLTKSLLNYYAAFNETRFRFTTKINYAWSDNYQTLDFSLFPDFSEQVIKNIYNQEEIDFEIKNNEYAIYLDQDLFKERLSKSITETFDQGYLESCINKAKEQLSEKTIIIGNEVKKIDIDSLENIQKYSEEGIRVYALAIRKLVRDTLTVLQVNKREEILAGIVGSSVNFIFNPNTIEQQLFDLITKMSSSTIDPKTIVATTIKEIQETKYNLKILDLFLLLDAFRQTRGSGGVYLFFHELKLKDTKYPLFYIEIDIAPKDHDTYQVKSVRNLLNLNVSAINASKFDKILATVPKACPITNSLGYLKDLERYILHTYSTHQEFLLKSRFNILEQDDLPSISSRIGFQVIATEDKKLLDYSELIGMVDEGKAGKIEDMIDTFINRSVESTTDQVDTAYKSNYPKGTLKNIIGSLPMPLSSTQKKILTALENPKNKIIAVDGPPGTGKSYLISAIVYQANLSNKSVLITSHKKEALDVVEKNLKERFQKLHPDAKPNLIRLSKENTGINSITNSLSSAPIAQAERRFEQTDEQLEYIEQDLKKIELNLDDKYLEYRKNTDNYENFIKSLFELTKLEESLGDKNVEVKEILISKVVPSKAKLAQFGSSVSNLTLLDPSFDSLSKLESFRYKYDEILSKLNNIYQSKEEVISVQLQVIDQKIIDSFISQVTLLREAIEIDHALNTVVIESFSLGDLKFELNKKIKNYSELGTIISSLEELSKISILKRPFIKTDDEIINKITILSPDLGDLAKKDEKKLLSDLKQLSQTINEIKSQYTFLKFDYILEVLKGKNTNELVDQIKNLFTLKYERLLEIIVTISGKLVSELTLKDVTSSLEKYQSSIRHQLNLSEISDFQKEVCLTRLSIKDLHELLTWAKSNPLDQHVLEYLSTLESVLSQVGLDYSNIKSFALLSSPSDTLSQLIDYISLYQQVGSLEQIITPSWKKYTQYFDTKQKSFDKIGDKKLKSLKDYSVQIAHIKDKFSGKYRLSRDESNILLKSFSCIISPTDLISESFPMEDDMIDILVIDEASQVSIAESLSLILRAKQVIVMGDELQYGAVGAVNVSKEYSEQYFSVIINSLSEEANIAISETEKKQIIEQVSKDISDDDEIEVGFDATKYQSASTRHFIVGNLGIRSSTMSFAKAMANYQANLDNHFRCFPEIISYSNEFFYRPKQMALIPSRIRTKPISEVIKFIKVETKGNSGNNVNLDEIYAIKQDLETRIENGFKGTIGIITSFKEQSIRTKEVLQKELLKYHTLEKDQKLSIWFVGDVQGEERDLVYYSLVEDRKIGNGRLVSIYPATGQYADRPENLKKQRLNVGFSRAKDTIVIVHSMPLTDYSDTSLGEALKHYQNQLTGATDDDLDIDSKFGSPAEQDLYNLLRATPFFVEFKDNLRLIAQFEIGKYLESEYKKYLPKYRTDFLLTMSANGKEKALIIEYDGVEYHTKDPDSVINSESFSRQYLEYDLSRQLELESFGYGFLRINKFTLLPKEKDQTKLGILDSLLRTKLIKD